MPGFYLEPKQDDFNCAFSLLSLRDCAGMYTAPYLGHGACPKTKLSLHL